MLDALLSGCAPEGDDSGTEVLQVSSAPAPEVVRETAVHEFRLGERDYSIPAEYVPPIRVGGEDDFIRIKIP